MTEASPETVRTVRALIGRAFPGQAQFRLDDVMREAEGLSLGLDRREVNAALRDLCDAGDLMSQGAMRQLYTNLTV